MDKSILVMRVLVTIHAPVGTGSKVVDDWNDSKGDELESAVRTLVEKFALPKGWEYEFGD